MSRAAFAVFVPANGPPVPPGMTVRWFVFRGSDLLVARGEDSFSIPIGPSIELPGAGLPAARHFLGTADGIPCVAVEAAPGQEPSSGCTFEGLRSLFSLLEDSFFLVASRALEVVQWDREHRHCGCCGTATVIKDDERARQCPACKALSYPRISPAVIVAVSRGEKLLLARARRFPPGFCSVLAGFVEPGETLEQCVAREVKEEVGIDVTNIRYFASQPWPFPHSLMIAFTADHAAGEITVDPSEIVEAAWYTADALPQIPDRMTVARRLIDGWLERRRREGRSP